MSAEVHSRPIHVLVVEDNPGDVRLLEETLRAGPILLHFDRVPTGFDALHYLRKAERYRNVPRPDLIILDLNLPKMDGRQVLAEVRSDPELNGIPIVILTSSAADEDVHLAFNFRAEGYVRKPMELEEFLRLAKRLGLST